MRRSKWILLALSPLLIYGVARFCHVQTGGFKLTKIHLNCPHSAAALSPPLPLELDALLSEPFTYLGRGKQSFAFLSKDKTTVLKLFNNRYQRKIAWYSRLPFSQQKVDYLTYKLGLLTASYELAFEEMQGETGLLYLHLSPTKHLKRTVTLIDKLGIAHPIFLDTTGFALQKKGELAYAHLGRLMDAGKEGEAVAALKDMLDLIVSRCKRGIADNDPLVRTNLGFLGSHPFYIDIGPFSKDEREQDREIYVPEVLRITASLKHWLEARYPALAQPFQKMVDDETTPH